MVWSLSDLGFIANLDLEKLDLQDNASRIREERTTWADVPWSHNFNKGLESAHSWRSGTKYRRERPNYFDIKTNIMGDEQRRSWILDTLESGSGVVE